MIKRRNLATAIILTIITCGIYQLYWVAALQNETLEITKEDGPSGGMVIVLSIITCGIYSVIWAFNLGERIDRMRCTPGAGSGAVYLILSLFGFSFVSCALAQDTLNKSGYAR